MCYEFCFYYLCYKVMLSAVVVLMFTVNNNNSLFFIATFKTYKVLHSLEKGHKLKIVVHV